MTTGDAGVSSVRSDEDASSEQLSQGTCVEYAIFYILCMPSLHHGHVKTTLSYLFIYLLTYLLT